ncbi:MAG: DUF58 domain-containing protein [Aggregatilineales bacterium]
MSGFVPFLLILFALGVVLRIDFFFTIFYLFTGIYLLSRFWVGRIKKGLRAERRVTSHAFIGDPVTLELTIKNAGWLPIPWIELLVTLPAELTVPWQPELAHLNPNDERYLSHSFIPHKRGYYPVGQLAIASGDVFGIVPRFQLRVAPEYLTVYPRVVPLQTLGLPTRSPLAALPSAWPLFEDTSRITGVRSYESGDSPRHIHWTASASAGQLLVKRYQPAIARDTLIFLDMSRENYVQPIVGTELAIIAAASVAHHIGIRQKLPVGLATEAIDPHMGRTETFYLPPRSERAHLMRLLEVLARVNAIPESRLTVHLQRERARLAYGTTLVVITGRESVALFDTLLLLQRAGLAVALILIQPARSPAELSNAPRGITIYRVWNEADLETKL